MLNDTPALIIDDLPIVTCEVTDEALREHATEVHKPQPPVERPLEADAGINALLARVSGHRIYDQTGTWRPAKPFTAADPAVVEGQRLRILDLEAQLRVAHLHVEDHSTAHADLVIAISSHADDVCGPRTGHKTPEENLSVVAAHDSEQRQRLQNLEDEIAVIAAEFGADRAQTTADDIATIAAGIATLRAQRAELHAKLIGLELSA